MKIMICGPIGGGRISEIKRLSHFLEDDGFDIVRQFEKCRMDYSHMRDFRKRGPLAKSIVEHDLKAVKTADILLILPRPSFGAAIEMYVGKTLGKTIVLFSKNPMPSPWPVEFSDYVVTSKESLVRTLRKIAKKKSH